MLINCPAYLHIADNVRPLSFVVIVTCVAAVVTASFVAYQPVAHTKSRGTTAEHYASTVRVWDLGFSDFVPNGNYVAFFDDLRADIQSLTTAFATVRLTARPELPGSRTFSIWDLDLERRVHVGGQVEFAQVALTKPAVFDATPSFYFYTRTERTRVRLSGHALGSIKSIFANLPGGRRAACDDIQYSQQPAYTSCLLPVLTHQDVMESPSVKLTVVTPTGEADFYVQPLVDDAQVAITSLSSATAFSGERLTLQLNCSLASWALLPWSPVLVDAETGAVEHSASFTDLSWSGGGSHLDFTLSCLLCDDRQYQVQLGESVPTVASVVIASTLAPVKMVERRCDYTVGAVSPSVLTTEAAASGAAELHLAIDPAVAPRDTIRAYAGTARLPLSVVVTPLAPAPAQRRELLTLTPQGALPAEPTRITLEGWSAGRITEKCILRDAFRVLTTSDFVPTVVRASQRVFFATRSAAERDLLTFTGARFSPIMTVKTEYADGVSGFVCGDVSVAGDGSTLTCTVPNDKFTRDGSFSFVFLETAMEVARLEGFLTARTPIATVSSRFGVANIPMRLTVSLGAPLPSAAPLELVFVQADGTLALGTAQWLGDEGTNAVFLELLFTVSGAASLAVREVGHPELLRGRLPAVMLNDNIRAEMLSIDDSDAIYCSVVLPAVPRAYDMTVRNFAGVITTSKRAITVEPGAMAADQDAIYAVSKNYYAQMSDKGAVVTVEYRNVHGIEVSFSLSDSRLVITSVDTVVRGPVTAFSLNVEPCADCMGSSVRLTAHFAARNPITTAFVFVRRPEVKRVWPALELDFSTAQGCLPYAVTLDEVSARWPWALSFPKGTNVTSALITVNEATNTIGGCLACNDCSARTVTPVLSAPFTDDVAAVSTERHFHVTPGPFRPRPAPKIEATALAGTESSGLDRDAITLIAAAGGLVVLAAVAAIARCLLQRKRQQPSALSADLLSDESMLGSV